MSTTTDFFTSCIPAIRSNVATCGALTLCDLEIPVPSQLDGLYKVRGNFMVMEALFQYQMETAMCMAQQSNLWKFFMANKVDMSKRLTPEEVQTGLYRIKPYILNKRTGIFDNNYWYVTGGTAEGAGDWAINVTSPTDIPVSADWFNPGERLFIEGAAEDGTATRTAWRINTSAVNGDSVDLTLISENANSNYAAARLAFPVTGVAVRGTANISDFESFCQQPPGLLNTTAEPYWIETIRDSFCVDDLYEEYRRLVVANNPLYRELYDLPTVQYNKQAAEDFQKRFVNTVMYNKALANQTLEGLDSLASIEAVLYDWTAATVGQTEGFIRTSAARCVGKKANSVGILEQLAGCDRIHDAQGKKLNLKALLQSLYRMYRIRKSMGHPNPRIFELCMPSPYLEVFADACFQYFAAKSHGLLNLNVGLKDGGTEQSPLGFRYRRFIFDYPDIEIRIISDEFFDDELAMFQDAATSTGNAALANVGRRIWIMDWAKIYLGIIGSEKVEHQTADAKERARIDPSYMCVMKVPTERQSLMSTTYTVIVERPALNLVIENLNDEVPEWQQLQGDYDDN